MLQIRKVLHRCSFVIRQVTEKSLAYNKPTYMCLIDLEKMFDRLKLRVVVHILYNRQIPHNMIKNRENIERGNQVRAK